ncbi:MAG: DUF4105 domain-containing protein, partial [Halobacteriovoraceae bacterium]|nr:DUF4105 domain-containing protein [Halobacteriovoraceae bacterium]
PGVLLASTPKSSNLSLESLALDQQWLNLVHFEKGFWGKYKSRADYQTFFFHPKGKNSPVDELAATINAFNENKKDASNESAVCRFPARYDWIKKKAPHLVKEYNVEAECEGLNTFLTQLDAKSISMVFSSYYLNSPASAFGHTLMRFNISSAQAKGGSELLDRAINYAANVTTSNALIYAILGLVGGFDGEFAMLPYFYKLREYNDFESRDLWSYELNLEPSEIQMMIRHLYEMRQTKFDYFYFGENCSTYMLAMLDVARPSLNLLGQSKFFVIPGDTIKTIHRTPGLVKDISFRPSIRRKILAKLDAMNSSEYHAFEKAKKSKNYHFSSELTSEQKVKVLDALIDNFDFKHSYDVLTNKKEIHEEKSNLLKARSSYTENPKDIEVKTPWEEAPHIAHGSTRIRYLTGYHNHFKLQDRLSYRFALHDRLDPPNGYAPNSEIEFVRADFNLYKIDRKLRINLYELNLVKVMALNPVNRFSKKYSWQFSTGISSLELRGAPLSHSSWVDIGVGYFFPIFKGLSIGAFGKLVPEFSDRFYKGYQFQLGPEFFIQYSSQKWRLLASTKYYWAYPKENGRILKNRLGLSYSLSTDFSLNANYERDYSWLLWP